MMNDLLMSQGQMDSHYFLLVFSAGCLISSPDTLSSAKGTYARLGPTCQVNLIVNLGITSYMSGTPILVSISAIICMKGSKLGTTLWQNAPV